MDTNLAYTIIGCAMNVYQKLGPAFLNLSTKKH